MKTEESSVERSGEENPCIDCGQPTLNPERCRECDIEWLMETWPRCDECGERLWSDVGVALFNLKNGGHKPGCSQANGSNVNGVPGKDGG
jgi:hypothetical protein